MMCQWSILRICASRSRAVHSTHGLLDSGIYVHCFRYWIYYVYLINIYYVNKDCLSESSFNPSASGGVQKTRQHFTLSAFPLQWHFMSWNMLTFILCPSSSIKKKISSLRASVNFWQPILGQRYLHFLYWRMLLSDKMAFWWFRSRFCKACKNLTMGSWDLNFSLNGH